MKNKDCARNWAVEAFCAVLSCALLLTGCAGGGNTKQPSGEAQRGENAVEAGEETEGEMKEGTTEQAEEGKLRILESFTANTLDEGTFTEEDIAEKDVTVINFWATFCGPCIVEMPDIAAFAGTLPENVGLVTVCLDGIGDTQGVKDILEKAGYEGITLLDGDDGFQALCRQIMYTPTTIVVDKDGYMIGEAIIGGQRDLEQAYTDAINNALVSMGKAEIGSEEDGK